MSLTPTAAWYQAVTRAEAKIRFYVAIYDGTNTWKAVSGSMDSGSDLYLATIPVAIQKVTPVAIELDPLTRETQIGELFLDVDDNWIRPIIVNNRIKGQRCTVKLGAAELDESDFMSFFVGPIEEIHPIDGHTVSLSVLDPFTVLNNTKITGHWINKHPLEVLYDGAGGGILEKCDLAADLIDEDSLDPSDAVYTGDISHFIVSRGGAHGSHWTGVNDPVPAFQLAQEITRLLNGHFVANEAGELSFVRFDASASAVDDWTINDIIPGSFRQDSLEGNVVNRLICKFGATVGSQNTPQESYQADDTASQTTYKYPGQTERILGPDPWTTKWLDGGMNLLYAAIAAGDNSLRLYSGNGHAVSGSKYGSPAWATVSAARPVYLLLDSSHIPGIANIEIVKATGLTINQGNIGVEVNDPDTGYRLETHYHDLTFTGVSRGQLDTDASAHKGSVSATTALTLVYDITILVNLFDELLGRFQNGCPVINVDTLLTKYPLQIGDLITLTWSHFVAYGYDGITDADKWEIVGKELDIYSNPPVIKWALAYAGTSAITRTATPAGPLAFSDIGQRYQSSDQTVLEQPHVVWGLDIVDAGDLDFTVEKGEAAAAVGQRCHLKSDRTLTAYASRDNYVILDIPTGNIVIAPVANGNPAPEFLNRSLLLGIVETDAVDITGITTDPDTDPVDNITRIGLRSLDDIQDGSTYLRVTGVSAGHQCQAASLASNSVEEAKINALAVTEAKIGALAVTEGKIGALAVTSGKIGASAVTTAKIDDGAVGYVKQTLGAERSRAINVNPSLDMFTKG